jgi:hypothetical protein
MLDASQAASAVWSEGTTKAAEHWCCDSSATEREFGSTDGNAEGGCRLGMEPVSPVLPMSGELDQVYKAQDGSDLYTPLPAFRTDKAVISRWRLTDDERQHIANGGDLFVCILNYGQPIWPIMPIAASPEQALETLLQVEEHV